MLKQNIILLKERIPIKKIEEPFCKKCMNDIHGERDTCERCKSPHRLVNDWYFNTVRCLGKYNYFENNDYKIPINYLSILISLLKLKTKNKIKANIYAGKLLADGLFQIFNKFSHIYDESRYLAYSPNFDKKQKSHCDYIVEPLLKRLKKEGFDIFNIVGNIERVKYIGKNKEKLYDKRFEDIKGVHNVSGIDLNDAKVIIIDDVYTTGSTSWDLSRALREQNAGEINVLAAGRNIFYNKWIEKDYENFNDLILYFSNLDIDRKRSLIDKVEITKLVMLKNNQINACIKGSNNDYQLLIDFKDQKIKHNCHDFVNNKKFISKRFCKHITKVFIDIREEKGDQLATSLLHQIYMNLDKWVFGDF